MIHVLNFNSQIIDFISRDDNAVTIAKYHKTKDNDLLDIRILSQRAEHFKKRNRIIIQDKNDVYREYIIDRAEENGRYVDVECTASHLVDISTSKPIPPGKYEKMTINQKLSETLRDSGWVVGDCDYAGLKTNSWTSVRTPLEMISQLETAHEVQADYEIEIDGYEVVERRVNMKIPAPLFKGKEIEYGKDLLSMKRVIDFSEVKTALFALGPEPEQGKRVETFVYDDEAQEQFDLPYRYIWGVYEPETEDDNMSLQRLTTLAKTELNKRKSAAVSYEISVVDIEKEFPHEVIRYGDIVRIKNPDFTPTLYAESEVVGIEHDLISNKCTYEFGKVVEYQEDDLLRYFRNRLGYFNQKFNDKFSNVNTIVRESIEGELQYFERKILKGDTPPENPINDLLWLDTSNTKVPVLRRYFNGKWIKSSAENASDVGAITREQAMYSGLSNTFINLTIQHSRLLKEVSEIVESEYFVDVELKKEVNDKLNATVDVFNHIKTNLDSMNEETATIGKLIDTQALFVDYREKMQALYNTIENAKIAIDERFKLLQSQYTDEKFNEALNNVASKLGLTVNEDNQLVGEVDVSKQINESVREMTNEMLRDYVTSTEYQSDKNGIIERLNSADTERQQLSNEISDRVTLSEYNSGIDSTKQYADEQVNNLTLGNVNLIKSYHSPEYLKTATVEDDYSLLFSTSGKNINFFFYDSNGYTNTPLEANTDYILKLHEADENVEMGVFYNKGRNTIKTYTKDRVIRFNTADKVDFRILLIARDANVHAGKLSLYKGTKELDWTPNPEDVNAKIDQAKASAEKSSKAYTDDKVQQVNQTLSTHETRLTQNGKDIALRATQEELNASKKTLSRVIADLTVNTTTGLTMTYDENGAIQSHTIGPDGIKLKGDRVDITVNKDFNVLVNDVANKADETNIINKLNLSREGLDINVNNIGIRGGSSTSYVDIRNDLIELSGEYTRTFRGDTQKDYVYTRMKDGLLRFRNNTRDRSLYYSDFGISTYVDGDANESSGTLQFFDYTYSDNARGVTLNSAAGVVALRSENNRIILDASGTVNIESAESSVYIRPMRNSRIGNNEFRFWVKDNDNADDTDGVISFGSITTGYAAGSSIRLDKSTKTSFVYATNNNGDIGTGDFYARDLYGNLRAKTTNQYALVAYDGEFRVTDKNGATGSSINYRPIRVSEIKTTEGGAFSNHSGKNVYFGVGYNELRITANNFWNGGNPQYQDIRFKNWTAMSHEKYKYDIEEWDYNVLDVFKNELQLHCYKVNSEAATKYARIHHGIVLRDNSNLDKFPVEWRNGDGFDGNEIMFWNTKAIQELVFKVEEQNEKIKKLEEQSNEQTTS
ncbi:TPA: phage tail spike protein [Staphylococcus pseudintermedius]